MIKGTQQEKLTVIKATTMKTINSDIKNKKSTAILSLYFLEESISFLNVFLGNGYTIEKSEIALKEIKRIEKILNTLITKHF